MYILFWDNQKYMHDFVQMLDIIQINLDPVDCIHHSDVFVDNPFCDHQRPCLTARNVEKNDKVGQD